MAEKWPETNRGYANRSPGEKIAVIVERGEEGDSQTAVGHGVQDTMAGGGQKEITPERKSPEGRQASSEPDERYGGRQERREQKRVGESAVAPEVAVADAEPETEHVEVGDRRAGCADDPNAFWRARAIETGSDAKGSHRV